MNINNLKTRKKMNINNLNFDSEELIVDYISFNITDLIDDSEIKELATYFSKHNFNSTFANGSGGIEKTLIQNDSNKYRVSFRRYKYAPEYKQYWMGTKVDFSGKNATYFYKSIKKKLLFTREIFSSYYVCLGRFDYYYIRKHNTAKYENDDNKIRLFLNSCCTKNLKKSMRRKATFGREEYGYVTRVGARRSGNYIRIYESNCHTGLKFELELKYNMIRKFQEFFFENKFEIFESKLVIHYYKNFFEKIELNSCYSDWLIVWIKKKIQKPKFSALETAYIESEMIYSLKEMKIIYNLFRFLAFISDTDYKYQSQKIIVCETNYLIMSFPLRDFIKYLGLNAKNKRHIVLVSDTIKTFLDLKPIIKYFSDIHFQGLILFPNIKIIKKGRLSIVRLFFIEELLNYTYPYYFSNYFYYYTSTDDFKVKFKIIQSISNNTVEKKFYVKKFLNSFNVSHQRKTKIKKFILTAINELVDINILRPKFKIIQKDNSINIYSKISFKHITKSDVIFLEEFLPYKVILKELQNDLF